MTQTEKTTTTASVQPENVRKVKAYCERVQMCGGGTSYTVYFKKSDKPSHPLHNGHIYCTTILSGVNEFFSVVDAIDRESHWKMEAGFDKYDAYKRLEKVADRLAVRIAKRAFPELKGARKLPALWAQWTLPSAHKWIPVNITLPV